MRKFGLIGRNISYSFSKNYFGKKFKEEGIEARYENFDLQEISEIEAVLEKNPGLEGLNVTIPYKEQIIAYLDEIDSVAKEIGAVNTVQISSSGKLKGYNTDYHGFSEAIRPLLRPMHQKAFILGTGGASKAIAYALEKIQIEVKFVSRSPKIGQLVYKELDEELMKEHLVIVNCTPLGTFPKTAEFPPLPLDFITENHLVFDLIYNPGVTRLMALSEEKGAATSNGLRMLELQAEKSWEHWNESR